MTEPSAPDTVPVIDISSLVQVRKERFVDDAALAATAKQLSDACRLHGFFYISNHGVDSALIDKLESLAKQFFAQDEETKMRIRMALGGRAWRGYFPVGVSDCEL